MDVRVRSPGLRRAGTERWCDVGRVGKPPRCSSVKGDAIMDVLEEAVEQHICH